MYLKRVKIFGFKSFADEVTFDFDQGLTAIVGPNGCGKSNLLDAINWVLGEQSAGRLRGNEMQDMIFKGSRTRKPLGVAWVELTLDNTKDYLPLDYNEVTVTRKLYRSGESEYLINKNPCRLKDVKELFLDTGIGTRSYSVMEQNNVRFILESSPLDRRGILEEAAGVRKYREKKLEAERRLERIKTDLNEVKNIMAEVQKNIRRLKRQTRRAEIYRKSKKRLWNLEVGRLCQEHVNISRQLGGKVESTTGLQDEISRLTAVKNKAEAKITDLENTKAQLEEKLLDKNHQVYKIESSIEIIKNRIDNYDSDSARLNEEISRLKSTLDYNESKLNELEKELENLQKSRDNSAQKEYEKVKKQFEDLTAQQQETVKVISGIKEEIEKLEGNLFELKENEIRVRNEGQTNKLRLEKMLLRKEELQSSKKKLEEDIEREEKNLKTLEEKFEKNSKERQSNNEKINNLQNKLRELEHDRENLLAHYHTIKSEFDSSKKYFPQLISIEELSAAKISGIKGPISALLEKKLPENDLKKLSKLLGEKLGWMIASDKDAVSEAIDFLSSGNLPPMTFIISKNVPDTEAGVELPQAVTGELGKIIRYLVRNLKFEDKFIWSDECIVSGGGENPTRARHMFGLEAEIEEKKAEIGNCEKQIQDSRHQIESLKGKVGKLFEERAAFQEEITLHKANIGQLKGNHNFVSDELETVEDELSKLNEKEIESPDIEIVTEEISNLQEKLQEKRSKLKKNETDWNSLSNKLADVKARKMALDELIGKKKSNLESLVEEKERLKSENKRLNELIKELNKKREEQIKQHENDLEEIGKLTEKKKEIQKEIGEQEVIKGDIFRELENIKKEFKTNENNLENLKNTIGEQKQTEERLKERLNSIKVRLEEDMNIRLEEALNDYIKDPIDPEEIAQLKAKLEKIGQVNLEAPEEYEKEQQRFEFIKGHVDDLEKADNDIRSIIRKINKQTKDKFYETFNKVNENFKNIFVKLFEGGDAKLLLTEPDNILESGIDIKAKPEGKNLTSLKLISGGESALTAIALMFAIYEVKPTPFCILDEVDSPLDDTNLNRFLRMLRDYTDATQFIIVTHNKQTMQMCDTFYGVTMEEFGVSKTISVRLKQAGAASSEATS